MRKNILEEIIAYKQQEVAAAKVQQSENELRSMPHFARACISLKQKLADASDTGIIAEFKRRSPSKGWIHRDADLAKVTADYTQYGASCLSVLTDAHFFGGSVQDLLQARHNNIPILRKDFIIDAYQLVEAKAIGADVILLIAACLSPGKTRELAIFAKRLGLEVLLELHGQEELGHVCDEVDFVGVNNRNLKTFEVDIMHSIALMRSLPKDKLCIAESGIDNAETLLTLKKAGFSGFLIGEYFMKQDDPGKAFKEYTERIKCLQEYES